LFERPIDGTLVYEFAFNFNERTFFALFRTTSKLSTFSFLFVKQCLSFTFNYRKHLLIASLYYNIQKYFCLFVWQSIGSAPQHDRVLRSVSSELSWPEVETFQKNFPQKWPLTELPKSNVTSPMLFYGKSCK